MFVEQLQMGIRYFDLRVCQTRDRTLHARSPFTFTHGLLGGLVRDGLEEINAFLHQHPKEVVLLDFNHFYDFDERTGHEQLIALIHRVFGKRLCTTARTINECTLNYLWNHQQQVILLYEQNADACTGYMDRIGHFFKVTAMRDDCSPQTCSSLEKLGMPVTMGEHAARRRSVHFPRRTRVGASLDQLHQCSARTIDA